MSLTADRKKSLFFLVAAITLVWFAYYPSILVPFYLDDNDSIVGNTLLHADNLGPLFGSGLIYRVVGYITLWGNYQISGLEPAWYHVVNIFIHSVNGILVYFFVRTLMDFFTVSELKDSDKTQSSHRFWALSAAALWMLHPLNSLPVIYIVQRLTSIVTLFMLLTILFYIKSRSSKNLQQTILFAGLACVSAVAGLFSKQNFFVVFVFLYFWEVFTAKPAFRCNLWRLTITGITILIFVGPLPFLADFWLALDSFTRDLNAPERLPYFYTQMIVLWEYIVRFFLPVQLQLNIYVELKQSFEPIVALALFGHIALIVLAVRMRKTVPLFLVGIMLFYSSHSVESFIIPIKDLAFEHRTYFGNIGLLLATLALLRYRLSDGDGANENNRWVYVVFTTVFVISSFAIFNRTLQWQNPLKFYAREVQLSPKHARANASYGNEFAKLGKMAEAEKYLKKSIDLNIAQGTLTSGVLNSYMNVLYQQRKFQQAAPVVMMGLKYVHHPLRRSTLLSNLAVGYIYMGYCDFALGLLEQALKLNPANQDAMNNRNYCLKR